MRISRKNQNGGKRAGGILLLLFLLFLFLQTGVLLVCRYSLSAGTAAKCALSSFCRDLHTPARPERPGEQLEVQVRLLISSAGFRRGQNDRFSGESSSLPDPFSLFAGPVRSVPAASSCLTVAAGIFTNHPARAAPVFSCRI